MPDGEGGLAPSRETVSALLRPGFGRFNFPLDEPGLQVVGSVLHMRELAVRTLRITGVGNGVHRYVLEEILRLSSLSETPQLTLGHFPPLAPGKAPTRG
ncbi:hypothetical protein [Kitasatospora sp. NBC_01302]|uniref:hypothetical protein n=1 Tax=Kitasatospora sp. NBC_01302 TaxID=2903575 RepID=UPI002E15E551|nr:hypothetical protein OG294_24480 [Kitasatospora sp. NBC_01302]